MMYEMFIAETLVSHPVTRRVTRWKLQADTTWDLLTNVRRAMGEPSRDLYEKYIILRCSRGGKESLPVSFEALTKDVRHLAAHFKQEGFSVGWNSGESGKLVILVTTHPDEDHYRGLKEIFAEIRPETLTDLVALEPISWDPYQPSAPRVEVPREELVHAVEQLAEQTAPLSPEDSDPPACIRISLWAYLRSMWTLLWTAFRHPFSTTVVDLATGNRVAELSAPFQEWESSPLTSGERASNG